MGNKKCLALSLAFAGLFCCIVTFYIVFFLPEIFVDASGTQLHPAVERFFRKKRSPENAECMRVLLAGESVKTLTSPNYPDPYPSNAHCNWLITTLNPNDTLSVKIEALLLEPETECRLDYLQVFLGSNEKAPSLGTFCGSVNNRILDTNSSTVLLVFHSDSMYEDRGFSIDYYVPAAKGCRELVTETSDTLASPGYPDNYPDDTDCSTLIAVGQDKRIVLNFDSVDLEYGENCTFDYIQIFDGKDQNSTLLGQICRESEIVTFESSSNYLLVHFHSDDTVNRSGYRARYTSEDEKSKLVGNCRWESAELNGTVTSPNYPDNYPSFARCSLRVKTPLTDGPQSYRIIFDDFNLEMDSNCSYDFLEVIEDNKVLGRFCGKASEPKILLSSGSEIKIEFQSDDFVEFRGFKLRYEFIKEEETEKEEEVEEDSQEQVSFPFRVKPKNVTLDAGSSHLLHCDTDQPNAKIRWLKGDLFLAGDTLLPGLKLLPNNSLWIRNMERHLMGQYTCVAVLPGEGEASVMIYVGMKDGGTDDTCGIEFSKVPTDAEFREGDFAYLECLAAVPEIRLSWEKDGSPLPQQDHVTILKNGYIFMDKVTLDDAGLYTCVARNGTTGCSRKVSATLVVNEETKIDDICGRPKFGQMEHEKPQSEHAKIVGGYDAPKGAYPWQVMLWEPERKSFCGATLLNERWILTAAHCFDRRHGIPWQRIVVKLGKHDTQRDEEQEFHTAIADSTAIVRHPYYKPNNMYDHDLALVRLRHRVYFSDYVIPICLADRNLSERLLAATGPKMGTVVGWGRLKENGPSPRYLQEIRLPLVDQDVCRRSTNYSVTRNMFCAGYSQEVIGDSCQGDSGGPFMLRHEDGRWYLLGIVSWGEGCGKTNKYGFYTRIPNYLAWIQGIIKS